MKKKLKAPKAKTKTSRRLYVVNTNYQYEVFPTKPKHDYVAELEDKDGWIMHGRDRWESRGYRGATYEMCTIGFEKITGIKLPKNVPAKLTLTVTF